MALDVVHRGIVACPAQTGIALLSWYCGDVYKCPSLCRLMQGRLFVVPWGKDFFIKVLCVFTHVCALPEQTGELLSHAVTPTWPWPLGGAGALTHFLSQQKQELGDTVNEPMCYFSIKPRVSSQETPLRSMTGKAFLS